MNQIPNIEETNTREELIKVYYKDFNHYNDIDVKFEDVYEFINHQLQKAREEERERIYTAVDDVASVVLVAEIKTGDKDEILGMLRSITL